MLDKVNVMIGTSPDGQGGIASVIRGYQSFGLFASHRVHFVASHSTYDNGKLKMALTFFRALLRLLWLGMTRNIGWSHVHLASNGSYKRKRWLIKLARKLGSKVIIHLHGGGFQDFYAKQNPNQQSEIRHMFTDANRVVVLSKQTASWISELTGKSTNIQVVYNTVPSFENPNAARNSQQILFLGNLTQAKGVYDLVDVFERLHSEFPNAQLRLGGTGDTEKLTKIIQSKGLQNHVHLLGWVAGDLKREEIDHADIFCLPSYHEQMPMSLLEAMSAKMGVVATAIGGIPDIIEPEKNGLLFNPGDQEALYQALHQLLESPQHAEKLAQQAQEDYKSLYCEPVIMGQLTQIYQELER